MAHPDAFVLKNSAYNAFLFAEIGPELNGSALTILSVLARLGQDPWAEAARWAKLPRSAIVECLAASIAQMPLCPQALVDVRETASRLVPLLPAQARISRQVGSSTTSNPDMPRWLPLTILYFALAFGMALNMVMMPRPTGAVAAPIGQTVTHKPG